MARPAKKTSITSPAKDVAAVAPSASIRISPVSIDGKVPWSFSGFDNATIYPDPSKINWQSGWVNRATRRAMMAHPKVYAAVNNLKNGIMGEGGRCIPPISPYGPDKADFEKAWEIARFCEFCLRQTGNFTAVMRQQLDAVVEGNKVTPLVFTDIESGKYKGRRGLGPMTVWPNEVYTYWQDGKGETTFLRVAAAEPMIHQIDYPRDKFWVNSFRPVNGNPNGTTVLAPAYLPFYRDVMGGVEEMAFMAAHSRPSINIFAAVPPDGTQETSRPLWNRDGTPVLGTDGGQTEGYQVDQNAIMFTTFAAGSINSLEGGSRVEMMEPRTGADVFRFMRESNAREITSSILGTHQMTESERNVSTANAEVGEGVAGLNINEGKLMLEQSIERDILRQLVLLNYGPSALDFLPMMDLGSGQNGRMPKVLNSVVGFVNSGAFNKDQWWNFCAANGLPLPIPGSDPVVEKAVPVGGGDKTSKPVGE